MNEEERSAVLEEKFDGVMLNLTELPIKYFSNLIRAQDKLFSLMLDDVNDR